ncbi:spike base protein, RCAP_Rcc01079 family [Paraurantiacibacter namhicola]|uniref:Uncharacterized protein n=1 Tax=Paraurantiacibacter namhicola TaxID=645517 RepID=A0A1C7D6R1_9SPHN|nr:hypothetical protein [Paraurantiacibacter namhicola]ANU07150.1 hypothetical protein A6F65_00832 [Paraurantiacibacter namhicola]
MAFDPFNRTVDTPGDPARDCFPVTPADNADLDRLTKAIYVGTGGDIVLRAADADVDVTFRNVPAGSILDIRVRAVRVSGTTAADLVGLS